MKSIVTELHLDAAINSKDGLSGSMSRIPEIVAIAGPNGAGKTRLLRRIEAFVKSIPANRTRIQALAEAHSALQVEQQRTQRVTQQNKSVSTVRARALTQALGKVELFESFEWSGQYAKVPTIIRPIPSPPELKETGQATIRELRSAGEPLEPGKSSFKDANNAILCIQSIADQCYDANHPRAEIDSEERERRRLRFQALDAVVQELLGTPITMHTIHDARLFGRRMKAADFSEGQRRLLAFATALFESTDPAEPTVLIMDEPELRLHPEAVIRILERISAVAANTQIWIATHSLPLLASLDPRSIWCIKDGEVTYAGNRTEQVLYSLMGGAKNVERLSAFLSSPAGFAISTFASECLLAPSSVMTPASDPQCNLIAVAIRDVPGDVLRILDWGAGRGRLAKTLQQNVDTQTSSASRKIDYFAYEPNHECRDECINSMSGLVTGPAEHHFQLHTDLARAFDRAKVDIVVMCNVLHEIDPLQWVKTLSVDISSALKDEGFLLIAEDTLMPHGEMAHQNGFLVLDDVGLGNLFSDTNQEIVFSTSENDRYRGRLVAALIPKRLLASVSIDSVRNACNWQHKQAKLKIAEIRNHPLSDPASGRELAFQLAQFANASMVLECLGNKMPTIPLQTTDGVVAIAT
jgi:ABC-type cobalamin/Fe3+-siderophores transport system ATPase subunit